MIPPVTVAGRYLADLRTNVLPYIAGSAVTLRLERAAEAADYQAAGLRPLAALSRADIAPLAAKHAAIRSERARRDLHEHQIALTGERVIRIGAARPDRDSTNEWLIADVTILDRDGREYVMRDQPLDPDLIVDVVALRAAMDRHPAGRALGGAPMTNQPTAGPDRGETPSPRPDTSIPAADVAAFADILGLDPTSAARRDDARRAADYHDAHTAGELLDAISAELAEGSMPASLRDVLNELLARLGDRLDAIATVRNAMATEADDSPSRQVAAILGIHVEHLDAALGGDR